MVILTAWWGMGYAALMVATIAYGWYSIRSQKTVRLTGHVLAATSTWMLWTGLLRRATKGHGWPFVAPADRATGIALLMLLMYLGWELFSRERDTGFTVSSIALVLLSYGLSQYAGATVTDPITSVGMLLGASLNLCGGSLLALAAAVSLARLMHARYALVSSVRPELPLETGDQMSETLVRGALFSLAISLAIDTWWLQKVGLGSSNDAQQAGIAVAWMVYFVALRLRTTPRWRGWPWTAILAVGFICILPILIKVPWLETTLPI